jgi:hypothetical protein
MRPCAVKHLCLVYHKYLLSASPNEHDEHFCRDILQLFSCHVVDCETGLLCSEVISSSPTEATCERSTSAQSLIEISAKPDPLQAYIVYGEAELVQEFVPMQRTLPLTSLRFARALGISSGNPLSPLVISAFMVAVGAFLGLLGLVLFHPETNTRYNAGLALIFVSGLAPIPLALLVMYSRRFYLIGQIVAGDYLVHWTYPSQDSLLHEQGDEVYISHHGIYWPTRRLRLIDFKSGLIAVDIKRGELVFCYRERRYSRYYTHDLTHEARVPIPVDREAEAATVAEQLRQRLNIPSRALNETWIVAWIMGGVMLLLVFLAALLVVPIEFTRMREQSEARMTLMAPTREARDAMLQAALQRLNQVIEPQMAALRAEGTRSYRPEELGFRAEDNVREIMTGFCRPSEAFYILIWEKTSTLTSYMNSRGVFHYVDGDWLTTCMPEEWEPDGLNVVTRDWNYVYLIPSRTSIATLVAETLNQMRTSTPEG